MIFAQYYEYYPVCPCTSLGVESKIHLELKLGWEMKKITQCKSAKNCSYSDGHVMVMWGWLQKWIYPSNFPSLIFSHEQTLTLLRLQEGIRECRTT